MGATHLTVWTANYLSGVRRERTAALEWNSHGDFGRMTRFCAGTAKPYACRIMDVDYYGEAGAEVLAECLERDYRRIVVDYGESTAQSLAECARCDRKAVVGSLSEWRAEAFWQIAGTAGGRDASWLYVVSSGSEEARRALEKAARTAILRMPWSADAFAVTGADIGFLEQLCRG